VQELLRIDEKPVLVISAGTSPINKKMVRKHFGISKRQLRMAKALEVFETTGYKIGTVPPFGHKVKIETIIDPSVMECHTVYGGGGDTMTMLGIESAALLKHTNAEVVNISK
jgi:prolyl-tRNA editing enzyme YbaK/EbsC (Cys-tRNA(Pro) deacylase)